MIVCFYVYIMISTCILYCIHMIVARFSQFHHQCVFLIITTSVAWLFMMTDGVAMDWCGWVIVSSLRLASKSTRSMW